MGLTAVIGGTGLTRIPGFALDREEQPDTPYGRPSGPLLHGRMGASNEVLVFLARHGPGHTIAPHLINYRANLWALRDAGCTHVIAVAAVGGIAPDPAPGGLAVPTQIVDYTWGREHTLYDSAEAGLAHVDFTEPYDETLRQRLLSAAARAGEPMVDGGTYGATQGPRLESAGEIDRMARDGCTLVGMTGMPEAALARELELGYAHLAVVVNAAAGRGAGPITMAEIEGNLQTGMAGVVNVLRSFSEAA